MRFHAIYFRLYYYSKSTKSRTWNKPFVLKDDPSGWYYTDDALVVRGPFPGSTMLKWRTNGYLADTLVVRQGLLGKPSRLGKINSKTFRNGKEKIRRKG